MREKSVVAYQISELQNFSKFLSLLTKLPNKYLTHFDLSCQAHKVTRDQKTPDLQIQTISKREINVKIRKPKTESR